MKIILFAAALLCLTLSAKADESYDENPMNHLKQLVVCEAIDLNLMRLHNQIAASMTSMSDGNPQVRLLRQSYLDLGAADQNRLDHMIEVTQEIVLPEFGAHSDAVKSRLEMLLSAQVQKLAAMLTNTDYAAQLSMQHDMLEQSGNCESYIGKLVRAHTY